MASNTYKIGDYVYFETGPSTPYAIRRIEELTKINNGNVEARVMCFYRRREIPSTLLQLADKHQSIFDDENDVDRSEDFSPEQKYRLKLKELFLSRQYETLPVSQIRGRCNVYLLNETEDLLSYLNNADTFFYSLVYEPHQKTLLADRGEIRVGPRFQADIGPLLLDVSLDTRNLKDLETMVWNPDNGLTNEQIDQFTIITKSVGTFARALDCGSAVKQPSLHLSVACASRDVTLFFALDTLHDSEYEVGKGVAKLVPGTGPVLCRDEMEAWSISEANLFEESLEKYGKDFIDIRQDFLPWKTLKSIIEYYYMWKTTDRYVQQRRLKAIEEEKRLKQIQGPANIKPNPATFAIDNTPLGKPCESCNATNSSQWYLWGPSTSPSRLCSECWIYWKKQGGLKQPPTEGERQGLATQLTDLQYPCTECNKVFHRQERLFAHMSAHRPYKCTYQGCDKEFKVKNLLARHITACHIPGAIPMAGSGTLHQRMSPGAGGGPGIGDALYNNHHYPRIILKTKAAFFLKTTALTKLSRILCRDSLHLKHVARCPFTSINIPLIKAECQHKVAEILSGDKRASLVHPLIQRYLAHSSFQNLSGDAPHLGKDEGSFRGGPFPALAQGMMMSGVGKGGYPFTPPNHSSSNSTTSFAASASTNMPTTTPSLMDIMSTLGTALTNKMLVPGHNNAPSLAPPLQGGTNGFKAENSSNYYNRKQEQPFRFINETQVTADRPSNPLNYKANLSSKHPYGSRQQQNGFDKYQNQTSHSSEKDVHKRHAESDLDEHGAKRSKVDPPSQNYVSKGPENYNIPQKRMQSSFVDAPDDLYFVANALIKKMRRNVNQTSIKKACRQVHISLINLLK